MRPYQSKKIQKLLLSTVIGITALVFTNCKKERLLTPDPVAQTSSLKADKEVMVTSSSTITTQYDITNSLPNGYVKDGSVDYTSYLQAAINKYSNITFPGFPILLNDLGLFIPSNKTLTFLNGSELRLRGSSKDSYNMIRINEATNVTLINPVIIGDRYTHVGIAGIGGGVGIKITGSSNVTLIKPTVRECWGDGIYVGQARNTISSKNITIKNAWLKRNRRAGISIISVDGFVMDDSYSGYADAVAPMCGVNFEPNNPACLMKNIKIKNLKTMNNGGQGLQIGLRQMADSGIHLVDFQIDNHIDTGSKLAFKLSCLPVVTTGTGTITGTVNVVQSAWNSCPTIYPMKFHTTEPITLALSKISITNSSNALLTNAQVSSTIKKCVTLGTYSLIN